MTQKKTHFEVIIIGGGPVGVATACALAQGGLAVLLMDRGNPDVPMPDGRLLAIAHASKNLLNRIGVWEQVKDVAAPIETIKILEDHSQARAVFDHRLVGDEPMGYMVEMPRFRQALIHQSKTFKNITWYAPAEIAFLERDSFGVRVTCVDGFSATAPLVIGADGKESWVRQQTDIKLTSWAYNQRALTCTITHEHPHGNVAYEWFFPGGPFAVLPQVSGTEGIHKSSIVWSDEPTKIRTLMALDEVSFYREVGKHMEHVLGAVTAVGQRWDYPLGAHVVDRYVDQRLALIGDAAHLVHPVAGQGLNLGFRDVGALVDVLLKAQALGSDLGSQTTLKMYERWRRFDNLTMLGSMDGLIRLFSNNNTVLREMRRVGLKVVDHFPFAQKCCMRAAMGHLGNVPKMLQKN